MLTIASAFVWSQLHEVGAGTGKCLVVVDETEMGTGLLAIFSSAWVGS